jgi:SRSO17 transposase
LVVRRSTSDASELAYYLSNAPQEQSLVELATVAAQRFSIEQCFEEAKQEAGLDAYQVRTWPSWHRHITLSMMAYAFLASVKQKSIPPGAPQKKTPPVPEQAWPR